MIAHLYGHREGRRHEWVLYIRSQLEDTLHEVLEVGGKRHYIQGALGTIEDGLRKFRIEEVI